MVKQLATIEEFQKAIKDNANVVMDFTASWCPPCQMIAPHFQTMSEEFENVQFYKIDVDENGDAAEEAGISCMPTF